MVNEQEQQGQDHIGYGVDTNANMKIKDLEEKQNILRERLLLIGKNLVEIKEKTSERMLEMKKELEILKQNSERIKSFLEAISSQTEKFAKKEDLEILVKQMKMFQPFIKKSAMKK